MSDRTVGQRSFARSFLRGIQAVLVCIPLFLLTACGTRYISPSGPMIVQDGSLGARVAQTARSQLGVPYRSGGTTPRGYDCSGLIWWAYRQHGVKVPRVTSDQARMGQGVSRSAARPGDILVFNTGQGSTGLHTALYTGNGRFVHSPRPGKTVREDNLSLDYWRKRLIRIRRY